MQRKRGHLPGTPAAYDAGGPRLDPRRGLRSRELRIDAYRDVASPGAMHRLEGDLVAAAEDEEERQEDLAPWLETARRAFVQTPLRPDEDPVDAVVGIVFGDPLSTLVRDARRAPDPLARYARHAQELSAAERDLLAREGWDAFARQWHGTWPRGLRRPSDAVARDACEPEAWGAGDRLLLERAGFLLRCQAPVSRVERAIRALPPAELRWRLAAFTESATAPDAALIEQEWRWTTFRDHLRGVLSAPDWELLEKRGSLALADLAAQRGVSAVAVHKQEQRALALAQAEWRRLHPDQPLPAALGRRKRHRPEG